MTETELSPPRGDTAWLDMRRVESWAGEIRVNLIRLIAIVLFYGRHLIQVFMSAPDAPVRGKYHLQVTAIAVAWGAAAIALHIRLSRRQVTPALKYAAVAWDAIMITLLCAIAGGPTSPLVLLYFPLIAMAPLRLSLRLVYLTTALAMLGYLLLLGHYAWYVIGFHKYYATPELRLSRKTEAIVLICMLVCGLLAGQVVRQARRIASGHLAVTVSEGM